MKFYILQSGYPFLIIGTVILFLLSFLSYKHVIRGLHRWILVIIRWIGLSFILFLFLEPVVYFLSLTSLKPKLFFLLDTSESMKIKDEGQDRERIIRAVNVLFGNEVEKLRKRYDVKLFSFSDTIREVSGDSLKAYNINYGRRTNLGKVFLDLDKYKPDGIFILSDGQVNSGVDPIVEGRKIGIPIYAMGFGDTTEESDIAITRVVTNDVCFAEESLSIEVNLKATGSMKEKKLKETKQKDKISIIIREGENILGKTSISIPDFGTESKAILSIVPKGEGVHKYLVSIPKVWWERREENNFRNFFVEVKKKKRKILVLGNVGFEFRFLIEGLREDKNLDILSFIWGGERGWLEMDDVRKFSEYKQLREMKLPKDSKTLSLYDVIIICSVNPERMGNSFFTNLLECVEKDGKGVLFWSVPFSGEIVPQKLIPVLIDARVGIDENPGEIDLTPEGATSSIMKIMENPEENIKIWKELPPLQWTIRTKGASPGAFVLAVMPKRKIASGAAPVITAMKIGRGKTIMVAGGPLFRWKFFEKEEMESNGIYDKFLSNSIRWLSISDEGKRVKIETDKRVYSLGEKIVFTAQIYDESFQPNSGAFVSVSLRGEEIPLLEKSAGIYENEIEGLPPGEYKFTGSAFVRSSFLNGKKSLGEDKGKFIVEDENLEFDKMTMNKDLLERLALDTGGEYFQEGSLEFAEKIEIKEKENIVAKDLKLWNYPPIFLGIIGLFSLEWFLRKRKGMN